ncbi:hypothetical protein ACEWY4_024148 [Coilia grayii]|uniref:Lymphotoxin-alpha n=1 Tax=Coilia grayii TaxID=363190 RepID=A0ABD1J243_9TELE
MGQDCKSVDLEVGLVGAEPVEELRKTDISGPSRDWRIYLAVLAIGLCAAAAIFFSAHNLVSLKLQIYYILYKKKKLMWLKTMGYSQYSGNAVEWTADADQAFQEGGLRLDNNEIVIPRKGLYFVYSQVSYAIKCHVSPNSGEPLEPVPLEHQVFRKSSAFDGPRTLLHAMRSGCERVEVEGEDNGKRWYTTINLGAVFSLHKGDRLFTKTEPLDRVDGTSGQTFFGVFAL